MNKYLVIGVLVIGVIGLVFLKSKPQIKEELAENKTGTQEIRQSTSSKPQSPKAGDKLADLAISKFAFQVFPGELTTTAKQALIGWEIKTTANADGTTQVILSPKNTDDKQSSYKVATGQTLYFVEMSAGDDDEASNTDSNLRDDYGVLVDEGGIIQ